jgi:hypothetical protein
MAEPVRFELTLPPGWLPLNQETVAAVVAVSTADAAAGLDSASGARDPDTADAADRPDATAPDEAAAPEAPRVATPELAAELTRALDQAAQQKRPGRSRYVYLGGTGSPSVHAWAHLELAARAGATPESLLAQVRADAATTSPVPATGRRAPASTTAVESGAQPWRRETAEALLAGVPAVVVDDLLEVPSTTGVRLHRRILVTLFHDDRDSVVQFQLSTPDLTAFDDPLAAALDVVGSLRLTAPSEEPA